MRRRAEASSPATNLAVFDGRRYRTEVEWKSAFTKFLDTRAAWLQEHEGSELPPPEVNGHCPIDWSRFHRSAPD